MRTVFVIDDDRLMREFLSRVLEKGGLRVRPFQSAQLALPLIDSSYPDAVVSDVQMPGMTGIEFAQCVRDRGVLVPIVLVTGTIASEVTRRAHDLGIRHVFEKPVRDTVAFASAVVRAISEHDGDDRGAGLDRLRLSFLTGLAHELRTPLTAMKLALEGLFAAHPADQRSAEGRLLAIGQRNLDRIIRLVEGQLDLLQITLGDVSVSRRLVSIRALLERAVGEAQPATRRRVALEAVDGNDGVFVFTDPDRLRTVVRHLLDAGPHDEGRPVAVTYGLIDDSQELELRFDNIRLPSEAVGIAGGAGGAFDQTPAGTNGSAARCDAGAEGFEARAFRRIVSSLSGEIRGDGDDPARALIRFPVLPRFDELEDFTVPLRSLREAALLSGRSLTVLKCLVRDPRRNGSCFSPDEVDFFQRVASALSEGDALVRHDTDGTYCLVLIDRSADEVSHVAGFLRTAGSSGSAVDVLVEDTVLRILPEDKPEGSPSAAEPASIPR
jgi:FixJ family two-component response regulator